MKAAQRPTNRQQWGYLVRFISSKNLHSKFGVAAKIYKQKETQEMLLVL